MWGLMRNYTYQAHNIQEFSFHPYSKYLILNIAYAWYSIQIKL